MVVHGDDFTFTGIDDELGKMEVLMATWYEIKVRGRLGSDAKDDEDFSLNVDNDTATAKIVK